MKQNQILEKAYGMAGLAREKLRKSSSDKVVK